MKDVLIQMKEFLNSEIFSGASRAGSASALGLGDLGMCMENRSLCCPKRVCSSPQVSFALCKQTEPKILYLH